MIDKRIIAAHCARTLRLLLFAAAMAFPAGAWAAQTVPTTRQIIAQKLGFKAGFTVKRGSNTFFVTDFRAQRSMIFGKYDIKQFEKNLDWFGDRVLR